MNNHRRANIVAASLISVLCLGAAYADTQQSGEKKPQIKIKPTPSIYDGCDILNYRGDHTIIPKKSILYIPEKLKSRVSVKPIGKFLFWPPFLKRNRNWIWTYEVTRDQAKGKEPMPEARMAEFTKLGRMVVATNNGNPIAVFAPQKDIPTHKNATTGKVSK